MQKAIRKIIPFKKQLRAIKNKTKKTNVLLFSPRPSQKEILATLKNQKEPVRFFLNPLRKTDIIDVFKREFSSQTERITKRADDACNHIFDLLGSGPTNLGEKINWHCDFKSGFCWDPKTFYSEIQYGQKQGVDVKVPWELSRFQHLVILGQAYWLTDNEKYVNEFIEQITDWLNNNPPLRGVNWKCTMDVAIRACNWILGFYFFKHSKKIDDYFSLKLLKGLLIHGLHIERNLEKGWDSKLTSNHYLSDIVGLVYLGVFFKGTKQGEKWLKFGLKELKQEMQKQVYPDGCDFEASTCYHRLVLELFFFSTLLVVLNDRNFNGKNYKETTKKIFGTLYTEKLYKMFRATLYLLKPNGRMPQLGDNDNGRLHIFAKKETLDMRYLLTLGSIFFKEPKFKIKEFGFCEEAWWVFGKEGYEIWQSLEENSLKEIKSRAFSDTGWYVMRSNNNYCLISCGPNGQNGNGGHCHNDKLSFELMLKGKDIVVDPGTYIYTSLPQWRNRFRSTAFHNTAAIDEKEQNAFSDSLFALKNESRCRCLRFEDTKDKIIFEGQHYGFKGKIHKRKIEFNKTEEILSIKDWLSGSARAFLIFAPNLDLSLLDVKASKQYKIKEVFYSPEYGKKEVTEKRVYYFREKLNLNLKLKQ